MNGIDVVGARMLLLLSNSQNQNDIGHTKVPIEQTYFLETNALLLNT